MVENNVSGKSRAYQKFHHSLFTLLDNVKKKTNRAQPCHRDNHSAAYCGLASLSGHWFEWDVLSGDINQSHFAGNLIRYTVKSAALHEVSGPLLRHQQLFNAWVGECPAVMGTCKWFFELGSHGCSSGKAVRIQKAVQLNSLGSGVLLEELFWGGCGH